MPLFSRSSRRSRRSRRRRDDGDGLRSLAFEIDGYEFISANDDLGLLRIAGRWLSPADRALGDIALVVDRGTETLEMSPLPDLHSAAPVASPDGEPWRAAFTVAAELIEDRRSELALSVADEPRIALPRPGEWAEAQAELEAAERAEREEAERAEFEAAEREAAEAAERADREAAEAADLDEADFGAFPEYEDLEAAGEGSTSPVMADLMAQLEEVAKLEEEMRVERLAEAERGEAEAAELAERAEREAAELAERAEREAADREAAEAAERAQLEAAERAEREAAEQAAREAAERAEREAAEAAEARAAELQAHAAAERHEQLESHVELLRSELVELARSEEALDRARAELAQARMELEQLQGELEAERRQRQQLEEELGTLRTVESDLRNAVAMQEAEIASAVEQEAQRARQAERRRSVAAPAAVDGHPEAGRPKPADEDFLTRLERARKMSETVG